MVAVDSTNPKAVNFVWKHRSKLSMASRHPAHSMCLPIVQIHQLFASPGSRALFTSLELTDLKPIYLSSSLGGQNCGEGDVSDRSPFLHEPEFSHQSFSSHDPSGPAFLAPPPLPVRISFSEHTLQSSTCAHVPHCTNRADYVMFILDMSTRL